MKVDPTLPTWARDTIRAIKRKTFAKCSFTDRLKLGLDGCIVSLTAHDNCPSASVSSSPHVHMADRKMHLPANYVNEDTVPQVSGYFLHESFHVYDATTLTYEDRCDYFRLFFDHEPTMVDEYWGLRMPKSDTRWWFGGGKEGDPYNFLVRGGELFAYFGVETTLDKRFPQADVGRGLMTAERKAAFTKLLNR